MKIQAIKKVCMARKSFIVINSEDGTQWISDGTAMWPTDGVPVRAGIIQALFDIDDKKADDLVIRDVDMDDPRISLVRVQGEVELIDMGAVWFGGELFRALLEEEKKRLWFVDVARLLPAENKTGYMAFSLRPAEGKGAWIAAYGDILVGALLTPVPCERAKNILEAIRNIADLPAAQTEDAKAENNAEAIEQMRIDE